MDKKYLMTQKYILYFNVKCRIWYLNQSFWYFTDVTILQQAQNITVSNIPQLDRLCTIYLIYIAFPISLRRNNEYYLHIPTTTCFRIHCEQRSQPNIPPRIFHVSIEIWTTSLSDVLTQIDSLRKDSLCAEISTNNIWYDNLILKINKNRRIDSTYHCSNLSGWLGWLSRLYSWWQIHDVFWREK